MNVARVHPDEGTLVRLLDGELPPDERAEIEAHVADCEACHRVHERIAGLSDSFADWVTLADPVEPVESAGTAAAPGGAESARSASVGSARSESEPDAVRLADRRKRPLVESPFLRAAAVVVLLAGAALAVPTALEWIDGRTGEPAGDEDALAEGSREAAGSMSVAFLPESDRLLVRVENRRGTGRVRLERGAGPNVEARVTGGDGGEDLLVLPDGLVIRNPAGSSADYRIEIPAGLEGIELHVAGRRVWSGTPGSLPIEWSLGGDPEPAPSASPISGNESPGGGIR